jgi:hypothetical protein
MPHTAAGQPPDCSRWLGDRLYEFTDYLKTFMPDMLLLIPEGDYDSMALIETCHARSILAETGDAPHPGRTFFPKWVWDTVFTTNQ